MVLLVMADAGIAGTWETKAQFTQCA